MSEAQGQEPSGNPEENADWFLQLLVDVANRHEAEFSLTLQVSGFLVSGTLIGGRKYFDQIADEFSSGFEDQELAESTRQAMAKFGDHYALASEEQQEEEEDTGPPPQYIHLADARFFHPSGAAVPANRGVLWRGRLSQVSGFNLGFLSAQSS